MTSKVVSYKVTDLKSLDENWGYIQEDTPEGSLVPVPKSVVEWIKELEKTKNGILTRNVELIGENAQLTMQVRELESQLPKWISTNDRLPDISGEYQVVHKSIRGSARFVTTDIFDARNRQWQRAILPELHTHWAELLPLPPEAGE